MTIVDSVFDKKLFLTIHKAAPFISLIGPTIAPVNGYQMRSTHKKLRVVLIIGSGPDAPDAADWNKAAFEKIVVINNAWQVRSDWDLLIHPEDFPCERLPSAHDEIVQKFITAQDYVPIQNEYGGFVYAGGTMAFTAGYWALGALKPDVLAFFGCDMVYDSNQTHFYGKGTADPLRPDVTLQSLEAKSARLMLTAAQEKCLTVNLSQRPTSRLIFPRITFDDLNALQRSDVSSFAKYQNGSAVQTDVHAALRREAELGYFVASGRYWLQGEAFDANELKAVDELWLEAAA